jgi:hypothetical protein
VLRIMLEDGFTAVDVQCKNCRYFDVIPNPRRTPDNGLCRVKAPISDGKDRPGRRSDAQWPMVKTTDWCGEFVPISREPPEPV